jgi:hypothetical protein
MKVTDEQFKVETTTNADEIIESFVEHTPIDKWVDQFTEDELELMQEHLSYNDAVECYNAIQSRISNLKRQKYLEAVKRVDWSDVATMIHPNGLEIALISRKEQKQIGDLLSFDGDCYRLNLNRDYYTLD